MGCAGSTAVLQAKLACSKAQTETERAKVALQAESARATALHAELAIAQTQDGISQSELAALKEELERCKADASGEKARSEADLAKLATLNALVQQLNPGELARVKAKAAHLAAETAYTAAAVGLPPRLMDAATFRAEIVALQGAGDLATLIAGARVHLTDAAVQAATVEALRVLMAGASNVANKGKVFAMGGLELLLDVMEEHVMERTVLEPACRALRNLNGASPDKATICAKMGDLGGIARLLAAADAFPGELTLLQHVVETLVNVMNDNRINTATVVAQGGMERLLEMMERHPDASELQQSACMTLWNLTFAGPAALTRLKTLGVEECVRPAMAAVNATTKTKQRGQQLLDKLPAESAFEREKLGTRQVLDLIHTLSVKNPPPPPWAFPLLQHACVVAHFLTPSPVCVYSCVCVCIVCVYLCVYAAREMADKGDSRAYMHILISQAQEQRPVGRRWWGGKPERVVLPLPEPKFAATMLTIGESEIAARGLQAALGLDDDAVLAGFMLDPIAAIQVEVLRHGSENDCDNFYYILRGVSQKTMDLPAQVKRDMASCTYHGGTLEEGEYDRGHKDWRLADFVNHETSKLAGLKSHHVLALRLYTSSSYDKFNRPLRTEQTPHPWRFTVYVLAEALKKLRVVDATLHGQDFNTVYMCKSVMCSIELCVCVCVCVYICDVQYRVVCVCVCVCTSVICSIEF